jgi:hypothetical protein
MQYVKLVRNVGPLRQENPTDTKQISYVLCTLISSPHYKGQTRIWFSAAYFLSIFQMKHQEKKTGVLTYPSHGNNATELIHQLPTLYL